MNKFSSFSLTIAAFVAVFLAGYWVLVLPKVETWGKNLQTENQVTAVSQKTATLSQEKAASLKSQALSLLPASDLQYDLYIQLEELTKRAGVTLSALNVSVPTATTSGSTSTATSAQSGSGLPKATITLTASGSYAALQSLVNGITTLDRLIQVDSVSLSSAKEGMSAMITASAYYMPLSSTSSSTSSTSTTTGSTTTSSKSNTAE